MKSKEPSFLETLIRKKTLSLSLAFVVMLVISAVCWMKIPVEVMPKETTEPFLYVNVKALNPGPPEEIELALTLPVEGAMRTISNVQEMKTRTSKRGCNVSLTFKPKTDMQLAYFSVQEALQELDGKGILKMKSVKIMRFNPEAEALMKLTASIPIDIEDPNNLINVKLKSILESTPGVAKIEIQGIEPTEYQFNISPDKVFEHGLTPTDLSKNLNFQNSMETLGNVPALAPNRLTSLKSSLVTKELDTVKGKSLKSGTNLTLDKVAKEKQLDKSKENISRKDGDQTIFIEIFQTPSVSLFDFANTIDEKFKDLPNLDPEFKKIKFVYVINKAQSLRKSMNDVFNSLYMAIGITFLVVFIFLRKIGATLIISIVIPVSVLFVVSLIYMKGGSLNLISLSGLILSIGLIVDNAIVVVEKITQFREKGLSRVDSATLGANDVAIPLLLSTLTTIIIFLSAAFIDSGDTFTNMLKAFQVPVISALISSYVIALFFVPLGALIGKRESKNIAVCDVDLEEEDQEVSPTMIKFYHLLLKNKVLVGVVILSIMCALFMKVSSIEEVDIDDPRDPYNNLNLTFNKEIPEYERKEIVEEIERKLLRKKKDLGFKFALTEYTAKDTSGTFTLYPFESDNLDKALDTLKEKMKKFAKSFRPIPGFKISAGYDDDDDMSSGPKKMTVYLEGAKTLKLKSIQADLMDEIKKIKGVTKINTEAMERGSLSFRFVSKPAVVQQYGLTLKKIASQITSLMNSYSIDGLVVDGKKVETQVKLTPEGNDWTREALKKVRVSVGKNNFVPLGDLGVFVETKQVTSISRKKGLSFLKFYVYFNGTLSSADYSAAKSSVRKIVSDYKYPKGYGKKKNESFEKVEEMKKKGQFVIYMSIFLIYLIMASLFESPLLPFAILFTVPLAIIFGISGLHFLKFDLDPMARLGLIILIGVVVNNAIILIDVILKLRARGKRRDDAIALGCTQRLKAVFMTTATTVFGLMPVALGQSKIMGIPYSTLGICIISGMTFSTLITLVLLPLVYILFDSLEFKVKETLGMAN